MKVVVADVASANALVHDAGKLAEAVTRQLPFK
jgi:hypothetical protein